ncbi:MAG: hypothetical protein FWF44_01670 [Defluviitaleaceae bacterium]|nr:hypothetical protein [Defluviitaleaceae bacterium]
MKTATKSIAILLAFALLFATAACGNSNNVADNSTTAPTVADQTAAPTDTPTATPAPTDAPTVAPTDAPTPEPTADVMQPFAKYPDQITITVGRENNAGGQFLAGQSSKDNYVLSMLKDVLNINYVVDFDVVGGSYDNTLLLRAASQTLPDTFGISNSANAMTLFHQMVDANMLADLSPAYLSCVGGMDAQYMAQTDMNTILKFMTVNGKIYGMYGGQQGFNTAQMWIRQDWLDKLGLQMPTTLDDLTNVAQAFVDNKPGGQSNTIGIVFNPDPNNGIFGQWFGLLPVFNATGAYPDQWITDASGAAVWGGIQPEVKDALAVMAGWTQSGIFSKDMFTMPNGDATRDTYVSTNACGIVFNAQWDPWVSWAGYGSGPDSASASANQSTVWAPNLAPVNAQGVFSPKNESVNPGGQVVLATCKYPEAIIKTANLFDELSYRNPDWEDVYQKYFAAAVGTTDLRTNSPLRYAGLIAQSNALIQSQVMNDYISTGTLNLDPRVAGDIDLINGAYTWATANDMDQWYSMSDADKTDDVKAHFQNEYIGHWYNVCGNLFINGIANGTYSEMYPAYTGQTDSYAQYWQALTELQNTTYLQIMSGAASIDTFDTFVTQWKQQGGDQITSEVNAVLAN